MASEFGIPKAYGSYEALLADDEIEAIYNPLPNHLHVPLTLKAARAGKHVLCEKPIAITAIEAEQLRGVSDQVLIAEAFMVRHHPQWQSSRDLVRAGEIGEPRLIQVLFSYFNADPGQHPQSAGYRWRWAFRYRLLRSRCRTLLLRFGSSSRDRVNGSRSGLRSGSSRQRVGRFWRESTADLHGVNAAGAIPEITDPRNERSNRRSRSHSTRRPTSRSVYSWMTEACRAVDLLAPWRIPAVDQYNLQGEAFSRAIRGQGKSRLLPRRCSPQHAYSRCFAAIGAHSRLGKSLGSPPVGLSRLLDAQGASSPCWPHVATSSFIGDER